MATNTLTANAKRRMRPAAKPAGMLSIQSILTDEFAITKVPPMREMPRSLIRRRADKGRETMEPHLLACSILVGHLYDDRLLLEHGRQHPRMVEKILRQDWRHADNDPHRRLRLGAALSQGDPGGGYRRSGTGD